MVSLPRSLRVRLQLWHALILLCVVLSFGSLLYRQVITARWDEIDADLLAAARLLEGALRDVPRTLLDSLAQDIGMPRGGHPPLPNRPQHGQQVTGQLPGQPQHGPPALFPRGSTQLEWEALPASLDNAWQQNLQLPRLPRLRSDPAGPTYYIIWRSDGSILRQQDVPYDNPQRPQENRLLQPTRLTHEPGRGPHREVFVRGPNNTLICVGRPVGGEVHHMWALAGQLMLASATILIAGLCGGWWLSRSAVEPIQRMTHTAENINATNLSQRIDLNHIDRELEQLGQVLNAMLGRLEHSFETQKRFAADASHELRTPLATILSTIELSLSRPRQPEEYQQQLLKCQRAAKRMHELVTSLLQLTRSDARAAAAAHETLDLALIVRETLENFRDEALAKQIVITSELEAVSVTGNSTELAQVVTNLVQNALAYNREGGKIEVRLSREDSSAVLQVSDTGIGIAPEHLPHIFERFYRADKSRGQSTGHGLGLAICQSIIAHHGGTITATSQPNQGTQFIIRLPSP